MSSPSTYRGHDSPQTMAAPPVDDETESTSDIIRRPMRVKVLYTFDDQNKSNCLARLPNALNIPTVSIDEDTQVGVIELKACIQAIVTASPELVAKLGHDYTVYAYDYSEYETPLVGQGMLSWILASASSTPTAPAHQSKTMVTGRVCKNILGLFSNGIKETLEVKLKLVPVPTCLQSEYVENMEKYRSLSKIMPEGFDYGAWADFLKINPAIGQLAQPNQEASVHKSQWGTMGGVESIHKMLTRPTPTEDDMKDEGYSHDRFQRACNVQSSRASSPTPSIRSCTALQHITHDNGSRPSSRASLNNDRPPQTRHNSFDSASLQEPNEEGPARKRARITKAKRPGKSTFGANHDSLLVTASTAASVRLHRPIPTNPLTSLVDTIEPPPRAPTPRPEDMSLQRRNRGRRAGASSLRQGSTGGGHTRYVSPYTDAGAYSDNITDSADDERGGSAGETPLEFPSSPPIMIHGNDISAPSSPGLPTLPYPADSGFVSDMVLERDDDGDGGKEFESDFPVSAPARQRAKQDRSNHPWTAVTPGPMELLPKTILPRSAHPRLSRKEFSSTDLDKRILNSKDGSSAQSPSTRTTSYLDPMYIDRQASHSSENLSQTSVRADYCADQLTTRSTTPRPAPRKRVSAPKSRGLPRSQTWSGETSQELFSDAPAADTGDEHIANLSHPRSGSGSKRTKCIKEKLQSSIAAGQMPPFCHNCGEIETPTWRKAYARHEYGSPPDVTSTSEEGGIIGYDNVKGEGGDDLPQQYRVLKQSLTDEERESGTFTVLQLCNPCGLWFNKKGSMRPPEVWNKGADKVAGNPGEKPKRKRNRDKENAARKRRRELANEVKSDAPDPLSSSGFADHSVHGDAVFANSRQHIVETQDSAMIRSRASSLDGTTDSAVVANQSEDITAVAALRRAIQSSPPARLLGTRHSPIELEPDLTPNPTRRLLFPSPRKQGEVRTLGDLPTSGAEKTHNPSLESIPEGPGDNTDFNIFNDGNDKENCPPPSVEHDEFAHLFEDAGMHSLQTTPSKGSLSFSDLLKTPTSKSTRRALTPKASATSHADHVGLSTPTRSARGATAPLTPFTAQLNALLSDTTTISPSQAFDFSNFPPMNTPGRIGSTLQFCDFTADDFLSSDLPLPSSPPANMFTLYEDPATSTVGLWSGTSIFDASDPAQPGNDRSADIREEAVLKVEPNVDFAAIIEEVVGSKNANERGTGQVPVAGSPSSAAT